MRDIYARVQEQQRRPARVDAEVFFDAPLIPEPEHPIEEAEVEEVPPPAPLRRSARIHRPNPKYKDFA